MKRWLMALFARFDRVDGVTVEEHIAQLMERDQQTLQKAKAVRVRAQSVIAEYRAAELKRK